MENEAARWPKISVVTPSFNQAEYIEKTILSVLNQGYPNLEYIIMDGGSGDGSAGIIDRYSDHLAYWTSQPDGGQTDALAKGFEKTTGDIQGWLCSDDLHEPHTLREVAQIFTRKPEWQVAYGDSHWIDGKDDPISPKKEIAFNRFIWMYDYNYLPQPSTFWRRELYEKVGGLNPSFNLAMDADLWARFAEHAKLHHVPSLWSRMRYYPEQKNLRLRDRSNEEDAAIRSRYIPDEPRWSRRSKKAVAKAMRIGIKLSRGAYW